MTDHTTAPATAQDENRLIAERRQAGQTARNRGRVLNDFVPDARAAALHDKYDGQEQEALAANPVTVKVAGRMMLKRVMGKASFATLQDSSGRIQIYLERGALGEDVYAAFKQWDIGDIIAIEGSVFKTNKGELSVHATTARLLSKSLRPLPDKFHGVADQELRYRQRYVDLIMTDATRRTFEARSKAMGSIRQFMLNAGFLEVETPMLHPIPGGAAVKPFVTHHNALDMEMFLRIAPELYLKRLIVGGFERVFEVNRNFRNEGVSPRHNPEFTMMEFYAAFADYRWLMDFTEELIRQAAISATGSAVLTYQSASWTCPTLRPPDHLRSHPQVRARLHPGAAGRCRLRARRAEETGRRRRRPGAVARRPGRAAAGCSRKPPKPSSGTRPTSSTTRSRFRRWRARPTRARASPSASSCSRRAARSPTASPS